jgi:hypothetical protein
LLDLSSLGVIPRTPFTSHAHRLSKSGSMSPAARPIRP